MPVFRKRSGSNFSRSTRPFKRSRFTRRPVRSRFARSRFTRRTTTISAQLGNTGRSLFRSRKISGRRWRGALLADTRFKPHYRSVLDRLRNDLTGIGVTAALFYATAPFDSTIGNEPWAAGGGLQAIDAAVAVPTFSSSAIVIRGGIHRICFSNNSAVDSIRVRLWGVWAHVSPNFASIPTAGSPVATLWDPSLTSDFAGNFKIIMHREFILLPGSRPYEVFQRIRPQKIDLAEYRLGGNKFHWFYTLSQTTDINALADNVTIVLSYNLSLVGDAI